MPNEDTKDSSVIKCMGCFIAFKSSHAFFILNSQLCLASGGSFMADFWKRVEML